MRGFKVGVDPVSGHAWPDRRHRFYVTLGQAGLVKRKSPAGLKGTWDWPSASLQGTVTAWGGKNPCLGPHN